ncbi:alpha/beta hydrolase [Segetibacter sp. 3557_3]|uniref:alpha/beta hydrolase n=1 Tax=Segetibacter sp. 3557_3 TaxID=2547429 RepID=UPI001058D5A8|nr:alpha/beta hydrolase [Segetibacter sp. 3557_3]TDH28612.1 alpha/beta hydrolase [Segetibacter sp. 3557_3]
MKNQRYLLLVSLVLFYAQPSYAQSTTTQLQSWLRAPAGKRAPISAVKFSNKPLSKQEAASATSLLLEDAYRMLRVGLEKQWKNKAIISDNDTLRFEYKIFGEKPSQGRSLFISMHGGGNAAARVNDQQWKNQVGLYKPSEGVYLSPRAPTNTWNLWHESHIDTLFDKLIHAAILFENVNPDKVYIMGYSAGGDGVYQLAPRMADHWAAAAMMAGHPNETSPLGLRNLPFTIHVGALDNGFNRNEVARRWSVMLDSLAKEDPPGYKHLVQLHESRPHWMNREDTVAIDWMMQYQRNTTPNRVVWKQDDMHHSTFYWLATPVQAIKTGGEVVVSYKGNEVTIENNYADTLCIRLSDAMMDLDKPVTVNHNGKTIFKGKVKRTIGLLEKTIAERKDPKLVFCSELVFANGKVTTGE